MSFLEKIKPHLTSKDFLIQETVLHAIHDYPFLPEEWTVQLLKEAFLNEEKQPSILIYISNQPLSEEAVTVISENIPQMDKTNIHLALSLFDGIDPELALKHRETLAAYINKDMWPIYELTVNGTEDEVYTEYGKSLESLERADSYQHEIYIKAKRLAACIVQNGWITEDEIDIILQEELKEEWFSFNGTLTVYMIGLLKIDKYIPVLASLLDRDDDILLEEVSAALIGFQTDEVVKAVEPYLMKEDSIIFASSIVENTKSELAVQVLRDAYHEAGELEDQDLLFEALCHQLSEAAIPEISGHMNKEYFSSMIEIEQTVYGYYSILGLPHPDLELWRQAAMETEMHFRNESQQKGYFYTPPIKSEPKIGRNDPCPCGSGKKYKKCCGK
ncbi:YecA family protein [Bacillus sp. 1NLA3E]|uniref:YecA family protein n=1 Tax=Bacillus sp. 1NLA3E TaxID=666686 RepID=UPI000247F2E0|nr:SEC-C metal-binding domain-containing protein [Bacillus sp. 1NLA3E]AGK54057.1 SEC-C motif domain-containing protein [Bacillus sp. 1NLA3E]